MELVYSLFYMLNEMSPYILLGFLIAGLMYAFVPRAAMSRHLSGTGLSSVVKAALIGVPLPLCSCGVLPTAIGMRRSGASRAASTSFLIATPQTGVDSIAATWSLLGPVFAVIRPLAALVTAVFGGVVVGTSEKNDEINCKTDGCTTADDAISDEFSGMNFTKRLIVALKYGYVELVSSIGGWLVIGLIIASLITVYVPADALAVFGEHPLFAMFAVLVIAIPMYVCATGSIPIALSLMIKGLSPGTAFVLLMAGPAANFASFALISREMGRKAALLYLGSITFGAVCFGLIIDYILPAQWFVVGHQMDSCCHVEDFDLFETICSILLVLLLINGFFKAYYHKNIKSTDMTKEYLIKGMDCPHCRAAAEKSIQNVPGVTAVSIDLKSGKATVEGQHKTEDVITAVSAAGFEASEL